MISHLKVDENLCNAKIGTDKAYSRNDHVSPQYTKVELTSATPEDRPAMKQRNRNNNKLRLSVEDRFQEQLTKFTHSDYFRKLKLFQSGKNNWEQLTTLFNLQTFMFNLLICSQNHGCQVTGTLGVEPPTVAEYLYSVNNDLLIPLEEI